LASPRRTWLLPAAWLGLLALALAVRLPFVLRIGPNEGGGDEWYAAWRSWCVLFERGNPGNFLHPALFYEAGAALFGALSLTFHSTADVLTDFVLHEAKYLQALQLLAAFFGALTVPVVFELGRRVGGWRAGLVSAGILAVLPLHVEYSQRVRVDSLCVLLTAVSAVALHGLAERGRTRDFVVSGIAIGLATGANYPAAFLAVAYVGAALVARKGSTRFVRALVLGGVAAVATFALTNPYMIRTPAAAWEGFFFQLALAVKQHPYNENVSRWFYLRVLRDQSVLFALLAACSGVWLTIRGRGFLRILGLFPWLFIGTFIAASNQEDRYILIATPWLCAAIGVFLVDASARVQRTPIATCRLILAALVIFGLWRHASPRVLVATPEEDTRWVLQQWLIEHAPAGGTVWLESDILPLLQATFADPGGDLQGLVQHAFLLAHPGFRVRVLKGERIERTANYDPALVTEKRIALALTCERNVRYVEGAGPEFAAQRAFYAALEQRGRRRFEAMGCWIAEIN